MKRLIQNYLAVFAKYVIRKKKPIIIAITGSVGKSSTKEAVFAVVSEKFSTRKTEGNFNNEFGLPLTILNLDTPKTKLGWINVLIKAFFKSIFIRKYPKVLVLEFGIDHPGDMSYLCKIAPPDIAILTGVEKVHVNYFRDLGELAHEKEMLLNLLKPKSLAIINYDNKEAKKMIERHKDLDIHTFGLNKRADVWGYKIEVSLEGTSFTLHDNSDNTETPAKLNLVGKHQVYTVLPAFIIGKYFDIPIDSILKRLTQIQKLHGRLSTLEGINNSILLDSSYNAEPASMKSALETLHALPAKRKVAILGDMLELGDISKEEHLEIAKRVSNIASLIFLIGPEMQYAYNYLKNLKYAQFSCFHFMTSLESIDFIKSKIKEGDLILIKASQGIRLEKITKALLKNPSEANKVLVRQSEKWKRM